MTDLDGPSQEGEKGTRCGFAQSRGCPRNCNREGRAIGHWAKAWEGGADDVTRKPGDLPSGRRFIACRNFRRRRGGRETLMTNNAAAVRSLSASKIETLKAALVALVLGLGLVYGAGFASSDSAHDAAHDSRHALSFPCH
jgi:cobalt transporter subunit CbtB